ncbi:MAG: site-specific integrase [Terriglobales bacterium]
MAKGWFRRKKSKLVYYYYNANGDERSKVVGLHTMTDEEGWLKVGELGLDKLVAKSDPIFITFGELAEKYLANYPFNKQSTKKHHEQIVKNLLIPKWTDTEAINIDPRKLKAWLLGFDVESSTRGKYKTVMSGVYSWGQCEGLIPRGEEFNPCRYVKGREFSQVTGYEALALEIDDTLKVLSELKQPEYEIALLVATCGLRISEALGLRWRNVLWDRGLIAIRETFVHFNMQEGAKTKLSRSRVEAPQLLLDALAVWRQKTTYTEEEDFVFPSEKLNGEQPRSASQLVEDYIRPAAIAAGVIRVESGVTYDRDGEVVKRFGFHNLGRHSLATFLMDEQENPAVVQAIMRHAKMDMTLYYSHSRRKAKRAAQEKVLQRLIPEEMRVPMREPETIQ